MPGWQIAVGAAVTAAVTAVLLDRARAARNCPGAGRPAAASAWHECAVDALAETSTAHSRTPAAQIASAPGSHCPHRASAPKVWSRARNPEKPVLEE